MSNVLRTLIYNGEVSLTLINTTAIVAEGARLHALTPASTLVYGKALSALAFMSACLKEERGEISISLQCDGECGDIGCSGNRALRLRGYVGNTQIAGEPDAEAERRALGREGSFTVVREDGYSRPFVGSCAFPVDGNTDTLVEEYYRVSEQLPIRIRTAVVFEAEKLVFAGVVALQPLPFASAESLRALSEADLLGVLESVRKEGLTQAAKGCFAANEEELELRSAAYKCNCSRAYLASVLITLGEGQVRDIIRTEGAVRVHCHYCNTDYEFNDIDELFLKNDEQKDAEN